jgi:hypothetical protein
MLESTTVEVIHVSILVIYSSGVSVPKARLQPVINTKEVQGLQGGPINIDGNLIPITMPQK